MELLSLLEQLPLFGKVCGCGRGMLVTINRGRAVVSSTLNPPEL